MTWYSEKMFISNRCASTHKKSWTVSNPEQEHRSRPLSYTHLQQNAAYVVIQIVEFLEYLVKLSFRALQSKKG